ncbi:MAG: hypothetical protein WD645_03695 [Dehalococcoidia bacterium]
MQPAEVREAIAHYLENLAMAQMAGMRDFPLPARVQESADALDMVAKHVRLLADEDSRILEISRMRRALINGVFAPGSSADEVIYELASVDGIHGPDDCDRFVQRLPLTVRNSLLYEGVILGAMDQEQRDG